MEFTGWVAIVALLPCCLLAACAARPTSPVCIGGSVLDGGGCEPQRASVHYLPFREGTKTRIMQGFHGYLSHKEDLAYSVDLECDEGDPITATRSGRVWSLREDSDEGCASPACMDQANYVILDHGDGTYGEYYHLRQFGVLVEEGEHVCAGDVVAICGNTGYSTGPHLHFAVTDLTRRTVPFQFKESRTQRHFGFPVPDARLVSMNATRARCRDEGNSEFSEGAFAHQGIILDEPLPTVIDDRGGQRITGRFYGDHPRVALHRKSTGGGAWLDQCVKVDDDGDFAFEIEWPMDRFTPGTYWLMITGASDECLAPGWAWSYKARVR